MDYIKKISWLIFFLAGTCFGTFGDQELSVDGAKLIWNNNSQTFSIAGSSSMSESVNYTWPVADGTTGQTLITDGLGVLSFVDVNAVAGTHDILSITHDDAVGAVTTTGDLIFSNATPKWDDLAIGAADEILRVSGGLPDWESTTFITELGTITTAVSITSTTFTDGILTITGGNITGADIDISAGIGDFSTSGTITDGSFLFNSGSLTDVGAVAMWDALLHTLSGFASISGTILTDGVATLTNDILTAGTITDGTGSLNSGLWTGLLGVTVDNITIGVSGDSVINNTSGDLTISSAGDISIVAVGGNINFTGNLGNFSAGVIDVTSLSTLDNSASTTGNQGVQIEQSSTGDASLTFLLTGGIEWRMGIDNTAGDVFRIASNNAGDSDLNRRVFEISKTGGLTLNAAGFFTGGKITHTSSIDSDTVVDVITTNFGRAGGVGGTGFGASHLWRLENSANVIHDAGKYEFLWEDPTSTQEDTEFNVQVMSAGSFIKPLVVSGLNSSVTVGDAVAAALIIGKGSAGVDYILTFDGENNDGLLTWMEDEDRFDFADDVKFDVNVIFNPSSVQNITAAGGITVTNTIMQIQGSGGAIDITADPQIADGTDGQLLIIHGESDTDTVTIEGGTGVHLHGGKNILGEKDVMMLSYDATDDEWEEITRNNTISEKSWSFSSPTGQGQIFYVGSHYDFGSTDNDFNPSITHGTANKSEAAHFFLVQAAGASGGVDTVIRINGTTINDSGSRSTGVDVDLTVDDAGAAGTYYETTEKWLGQVTISVLSGPDLLMNYGFTKYYDRHNTQFIILGFETTWLAGASDSNIEMQLFHHKTTGWTYNSGSTPTPPTPLAKLTDDHSTDDQTVKDENGAWKRDNLNTAIDGGNGEGIIIEITTTLGKTFQAGNFSLVVRPD